ncbi:hypothetical protein [Methyloglobulus sp.]|uniref:hypothetical protein n=1 Tax=Methyloglobulus sp. TaxID=2518622 RepID=UPI0017A7EA2F|nr:hypothetical protein [Methyloglobulus sp.]
MSTSLPVDLIISWIVFVGFVNTHQRHAMHFRGASQGYLLALQVSVLVGSLVGLGLLGYYFMQVAWYWPIVLFVVSSLVGGLLFGVLDGKIGQLGMSMLAFFGWPASAVWAFLIINGLHP